MEHIEPPKKLNMEKVTIKELVEYLGKSDRGKKAYAVRLKTRRSTNNTKGGGNYWISCLSTISNVFKSYETVQFDEKIEKLREAIEVSDVPQTKTRFQKNIDILHNFQEYDYSSIRPQSKMKFHKKPKAFSIIRINDLPIEVVPNHVFSFQEDDHEQIGAIWFVAQLDGFKINELAMFSDVLYRYLNLHFSERYTVNPMYCTAVDVFNGTEVSYAAIQKGEAQPIIDRTTSEISRIS